MGGITMWKRKLVGERGFEPPAPTSRTWCSTRLSYSPQQRAVIAMAPQGGKRAGFRAPRRPVAALPPSRYGRAPALGVSQCGAGLGRSQAVRHRILIPAFEGSIPSAPATEIFLASKARLENPEPGAHFQIRALTKAAIPRECEDPFHSVARYAL